MSENIFVKAYSFLDQVHLLGAFMDVFAVHYPQIQGVDLLDAPSKRLMMFDTSGHRPLWEQPAQFHELMLTVLAESAP